MCNHVNLYPQMLSFSTITQHINVGTAPVEGTVCVRNKQELDHLTQEVVHLSDE